MCFNLCLLLLVPSLGPTEKCLAPSSLPSLSPADIYTDGSRLEALVILQPKLRIRQLFLC